MENKGPLVIIQDALRRAVEKETEGAVTVLYDDTGIPSYMMRIPRFNVETIDSSLGRGPHPAFVVDGKTVNEIFVGQVNAKIIDGCAYSIPGEDATRNITFDEARAACTKKGKGWHLLNNWEYAALVMYLVKNHNRYFAKDWWEWIDGLKIIDGEIFSPRDNHFELPEKDWPSYGVFFDDIEGSPVLSTKITHYSEPDPKGADDDRDDDYTHLAYLSRLTASSQNPLAHAELERLSRMLIYPSATPVITQTDADLFVRNYGERLPIRDGYWNYGAAAGLASLDLANVRSDSSSNIGCRPAFIGI